MSTRPFRFGAKATKAKSAKEWTDLARQAEDLGYASFQMDDHMGNQLAIVPALMSAADATSKIQIGPHVAGVDFRNPVVFAKECATIDLLSEGRFTLGIGAGWSNKDYAIAGIRQDDASTRIERLGEAVTIMKGLWGEGPFSFSGSHYEVAEVDAGPKPYSPIPVMIGGGGPKILAMAAQQADIVGINPKIVGRSINPRSMATTAADTMDEKVAWVKEAAGDRFDDLELNIAITALPRDESGQPDLSITRRALPNMSEEELLATPAVLSGSTQEIADTIRGYRDTYGVSYLIVQDKHAEAFSEVIAELR